MSKIITLDEAVQRRLVLKVQSGRLILTNGHFDLLHVGHLDYLEKARSLGDALYVGVNGDASTARLKGPGRPLVPAIERARLLAALTVVNAVIIFAGDTAIPLVEKLQPDVYVKGGDYRNKRLPEYNAVKAYGGRIMLIDYLEGHSTTNLIARIKALPDQ
ncbi:MAG: adenylyltransferase/cytidyltransferase family protein [Chloroflexi bacterium]|nr:adenylyltransferase/cytidyltransferase family protein [Chloroflexota bacterium]